MHPNLIIIDFKRKTMLPQLYAQHRIDFCLPSVTMTLTFLASKYPDDRCTNSHSVNNLIIYNGLFII